MNGHARSKTSVPEKLLNEKSSHLATEWSSRMHNGHIARVEAPCRAVPRNFRASFVFDGTTIYLKVGTIN